MCACHDVAAAAPGGRVLIVVYVPNSSNQFVAGFAVANAYPAYRCDVTRLRLSAVFIAAVNVVFYCCSCCDRECCLS